MIAECFGVPGSGKSVLTSRLSSRKGFGTVPRYVPRLQSFLFTVVHPIFVLLWVVTLMRECWQTHTWVLFRFKISVFANTIGRIQYADTHAQKENVTILDEGLLQRMLSLFETVQTPKRCALWLRYIPKTRVIVHTKSTDNVMTKQKLSTQRLQFGSEYEEKILAVLNTNYQNFKLAAERSELRQCSYEWDERADNLEETVLCICAHMRDRIVRK